MGDGTGLSLDSFCAGCSWLVEVQGASRLAFPSLVVAIVVSLPVLSLYRRRVLRSLAVTEMRTSGAPASAGAVSSASGQSNDASIPWPSLAEEAVGHCSRLMRLYLVAGVALALALAVVDTLANRDAQPPSVLRAAFAAVSFTAPLVLTVRLVLGRWRPGLPLLAAQLAAFVVLSQLSWQVTEDPTELAIEVAILLAILLHPRIRAMGMLAAAFFMVVFVMFFVSVVVSIVVMQGPIAADVMSDPRTPTLILLLQRASSSAEAAWEVFTSSQDFIRTYALDHVWSVLRHIAILILAGLVAAMATGTALFRVFAMKYARKHVSDQWLLVSSMWLYFTLAVASVHSPIGLVGNAAAYLAWWAGVRYAFTRLPHYRGPGVRLLLLRSFTLGQRSERLFEQLEAMWRSVGSIQLVGAADVALTTLEPHELLDFMRGRSNREFVHDQAGVDTRLASFDRDRDPDGRFRVNVIYCAGDSTWKYAVHRLLAESDCVLMDVRGFTRYRAGCVFEIRCLAESAARPKVVFLADQATDRTFVTETWRSATPSSESGQSPELLFLTEGSPKETIGERILTALGSSDTAARSALPA